MTKQVPQLVEITLPSPPWSHSGTCRAWEWVSCWELIACWLENAFLEMEIQSCQVKTNNQRSRLKRWKICLNVVKTNKKLCAMATVCKQHCITFNFKLNFPSSRWGKTIELQNTWPLLWGELCYKALRQIFGSVLFVLCVVTTPRPTPNQNMGNDLFCSLQVYKWFPLNPLAP